VCACVCVCLCVFVCVCVCVVHERTHVLPDDLLVCIDQSAADDMTPPDRPTCGYVQWRM
jgi:hypothetical protein